MTTISKSDIERSIDLLNDLTGNTKKFGIEYSYGGCRLTSNDGSVNISERGTKRETYTFIRAYIDGVETGYDFAMRKVSKWQAAERKSRENGSQSTMEGVTLEELSEAYSRN